jgi:hypothetical protein
MLLHATTLNDDDDDDAIYACVCVCVCVNWKVKARSNPKMLYRQDNYSRYI